MKKNRFVICSTLPVFAVCLLLSAFLASDACYAADDDEFLISLPTKKPKNQQTSSSASSKTEEQPPVIRQEDKLPGVIYDLSRTSARKPTNLLEIQNSPDATEVDFNAVPVLKKFILSDWMQRGDNKGNRTYTELNQYYRSPVIPYRSFFFQQKVDASVMRSNYTEQSLSNQGWLVIHSGFVVAPFSGKFRFVGCGDDALVIRFNRQIVLDYGCYQMHLGKRIYGPDEYRTFVAQKSKGRLLPEKDFYSGNLEVAFANNFDKLGAAKGLTVSVVKGQVYPIEILYADIGEGKSFLGIFIEPLDHYGKPQNENPDKLPLFRTTPELPSHPTGDSLPDFDEDSPIWNVVDSRGKPIPSRTPASAEQKKMTSEPKKTTPETSTKTDSASSAVQEKQTSTQPKNNDPKPKKTVKTTKRGNVTTQTITEYQGDTTIETVTTTEVNGDTTTQTTVVTETKNGSVVKKTTSTTATTTSDLSSEMESAASREPEKKQSSSSGKTSSSSSNNSRINPFGQVQRPLEDD